MVYGVVSQADNDTTMAVFRSKKVRPEHLADSSRLGELARCLVQGDTVYTVSVNRFASVAQVREFGCFCANRGVSLKFIGQPYLDITDGKMWKRPVLRQMEQMETIEAAVRQRLAQCFRMEKSQWQTLFWDMEAMNLEILAQIFSPDGVLKRG